MRGSRPTRCNPRLRGQSRCWRVLCGIHRKNGMWQDFVPHTSVIAQTSPPWCVLLTCLHKRKRAGAIAFSGRTRTIVHHLTSYTGMIRTEGWHLCQYPPRECFSPEVDLSCCQTGEHRLETSDLLNGILLQRVISLSLPSLLTSLLDPSWLGLQHRIFPSFCLSW